MVDCFGAHLPPQARRGRDDAATSTSAARPPARSSPAGSRSCSPACVPVGGDHFNRAVAQALKISVDEARLLRIKLCAACRPARRSSPDAERRVGHQRRRPARPLRRPRGRRGRVAAQHDRRAAARRRRSRRRPTTRDAEARRPSSSCREPVAELVEELELCRRYHEATFPSRPVDRADLRRRRGPPPRPVPADRPRDATGRAGRRPDGADGPDQRHRHPRAASTAASRSPDWAVAIGLSMGPGGDGPTAERQPTTAAVAVG